MRILLVEDEMLVAMLLEESLADLGCEVVGPIARVDAAKRAIEGRNIEDQGFDCALLDVNVRGQPIYPVAELLAEYAVPFGFVTGYGRSDVAAKFADRPILHKPFTSRDLAAILGRLLPSGRKARPTTKR